MQQSSAYLCLFYVRLLSLLFFFYAFFSLCYRSAVSSSAMLHGCSCRGPGATLVEKQGTLLVVSFSLFPAITFFRGSPLFRKMYGGTIEFW